MIKRQCADCGGELVLAVNSVQPEATNGGPGLARTASTRWRCTTCGSAFTATQLRQDKHDRSKLQTSA